jgi:hypothetical protein
MTEEATCSKISIFSHLPRAILNFKKCYRSLTCIGIDVDKLKNFVMMEIVESLLTFRKVATNINVFFVPKHFSLRNLIIRLRDSAKKACPPPSLVFFNQPNLFPHFCQYLSIGFDAESERVASQLTISYLCTYVHSLVVNELCAYFVS